MRELGSHFPPYDPKLRMSSSARWPLKASARGWSLVSRAEIEALAFIADLILEDADLAEAASGHPAPPVISPL